MTGTIRQFFAEHPDKFDPREYLKPARANIKEMVKHKLSSMCWAATAGRNICPEAGRRRNSLPLFSSGLIAWFRRRTG